MAISSSELPQRGPWHGHTLGQSWVQTQFFISGELLNLPEPQLPLLGNEVGWALSEKMCWKCPALCPVYKSHLISVILIISSFLPAPSDRCVGASCLQPTKGAEDAALAVVPGGNAEHCLQGTPPHRAPHPPAPRVPGVAVPTAAARGRLGPWFSGAEGAQAAGRSEPELNQGYSSGITGIIIGKNNSNGTGSSSHQLLPI